MCFPLTDVTGNNLPKIEICNIPLNNSSWCSYPLPFYTQISYSVEEEKDRRNTAQQKCKQDIKIEDEIQQLNFAAQMCLIFKVGSPISSTVQIIITLHSLEFELQSLCLWSALVTT